MQQGRAPALHRGHGQDAAHLKSLAGNRTRFLGRMPAEELKKIYCRARALLFPGEEDFGISPLEALACGTPVIAFGRGGVTETVHDGETGLFFGEQTVDSLSEKIMEFERREDQSIRSSAAPASSPSEGMSFKESSAGRI